MFSSIKKYSFKAGNSQTRNILKPYRLPHKRNPPHPKAE